MTLARATHVTHQYGDVTALDDVSLEVAAGELVGLLGPNGAGKSTLINLFTGLRRPTKGQIELFGGDPHHATHRQHIGMTPQDTGLPPGLRVAEVIDYVSAHYANPIDKNELLSRFSLDGLQRRQTGGLSGGQKRRLAVALAFIGQPKLVFLDEPTTGLDVESRHALWEVIRTFHADGGTVVVTSHYLEEIEALAKRVVVVGDGKILADDTMDAVRDKVAVRTVSFTGIAPEGIAGVVSAHTDGDRTHLLTADPDRLVRELVTTGVDFKNLDISQTSLEDAFLAITA